MHIVYACISPQTGEGRGYICLHEKSGCLCNVHCGYHCFMVPVSVVVVLDACLFPERFPLKALGVIDALRKLIFCDM